MMRRYAMTIGSAVIALGAFAGCSSNDVVATPSDDLSSSMGEVAIEADQITEEIVMAELAAMELAPATRGAEGSGMTERSFERTRSCPVGGELTVTGNILRSWDAATGVMEAEASGSRTRVDCTFARAELTIVVNGSASWEKLRRRVDGVPDGPQSSSYAGSWTALRSDGEERSCSYDLTIVRDPATQTLTIDGTICTGRFRRQLGWSPNG